MAFQRYASYYKWEMLSFCFCKWIKFYADYRYKQCKWNTISNSVTTLPWKCLSVYICDTQNFLPLEHSLFIAYLCEVFGRYVITWLFIDKCVSLTDFSGRHLLEAFHAHAQSSQFVDCLLSQDGKLVERVIIVPQTPINTLAQHQQLWCHQWPVLTDSHLKQCPNNPSTILYNTSIKTMHAYLP